MSKRILVISPVPTHPQNAGNRARVYNLLRSLAETGNDIYFLHIRETPGNESLMLQCWGNKFYASPYHKPSTAIKSSRSKFDQIITKKIRAILGSDPYYNYLIDDWYDHAVDELIIHLADKLNPHIVIVEYVFFSKALQCFNQNVLKIIDTHDIFADRYKLYLKRGQTPRWFSTSESEEIRGLQRADIIIAIQQREAAYFAARLRDKQVITVGHMVSLHKPIERELKYSVLFLASKNPINVDGINCFIKKVFPAICTGFPKIKLLLAGEICNEIADFDNCIKLGSVDSLANVYDLADIVINPVRCGTGLKIKNIEALGFAKPLITTSSGAEGMEDGVGQAFLVAETPQQFVSLICELFLNSEMYRHLSESAYNYAKKWNRRCLEVLMEALQGASV